MLEADILVIGSPIWLGQPSSVSKRVLERMDAFLDENADVFEADGMLQIRDLMELASLDVPALHDPPHHPIDQPRLQAEAQRSIFHILRDVGSILLAHPYESFSTSVERFLREASVDPKTAI